MKKSLKYVFAVILIGLCFKTSIAKKKIVMVDKNCIDGQYVLSPNEQFLKVSEFQSISDLVSAYTEENYMTFITGVLDRRYPTGNAIIEKGGGASAVDRWLYWKSDASQVLRSLGTVIHEIGHGIDEHGSSNIYYIAKTNEGNLFNFSVPGMHGKGTTTNSPMFSIARSMILADDQNFKRPPAESEKIKTSKEFGEGDFGCDKSYAETYLNGHPDDGEFQGGDQGFNMLIEEFTQYVNSMAFAYYFQDQHAVYDRASSHRHAMLTYQWWLQRYLRKIRLEHEEQYEYLTGNEEWRNFILTIWGRSWLYLNNTVAGMQPDTDYLMQLIQQEEVLVEIQNIRDMCGCDDTEELMLDFTNIGKDLSKVIMKQGSFYSHYNPQTKKLTVSLGRRLHGSIKIELLSIKGQKISELYNSVINNKEIITMSPNKSKLSNGMYLLKVKTNNVTNISKLLM